MTDLQNLDGRNKANFVAVDDIRNILSSRLPVKAKLVEIARAAGISDDVELCDALKLPLWLIEKYKGEDYTKTNGVRS